MNPFNLEYLLEKHSFEVILLGAFLEEIRKRRQYLDLAILLILVFRDDERAKIRHEGLEFTVSSVLG